MCPGEWAQRDISQTGGEAEYTVGGGGEGDEEEEEEGKDGLVRKKAVFSRVLLCFPLCKPWSPAACQQAK